MGGPTLNGSLARVGVALAAALALADASIVTLGLPSILSELDTTVEGVALVLGVYTAVLALALLPVVWLSRRVGGAAVAAGGIAVFGLASLACGSVDSMDPLLVLRGIQAVGGAGTLIGAFALLDAGQEGPGRRLWFTASIFGAAIGPALGGALTEAFDWRAIFLAQVPLVVPGLLVAGRAALQGRPGEARTEPADSPLAPRPARRPGPAVGGADGGHLPRRAAAGRRLERRSAGGRPGRQRAAGCRRGGLTHSRGPEHPSGRRLPAGRRRSRLPGAAAGRLGLVDRGAATARRRRHGVGAARAGGRAAARAHPPRRRAGAVDPPRGHRGGAGRDRADRRRQPRHGDLGCTPAGHRGAAGRFPRARGQDRDRARPVRRPRHRRPPPAAR